MTNYQQLDKILNYMVCHLDEISLSPDIITKKAGMTLDKSTAYLMFDIWQRTAILKREKETGDYIILYKGVLFYENGGKDIFFTNTSCLRCHSKF